MKILHLICSLEAGGAEKLTAELVAGLAARAHEVALVMVDRPTQSAHERRARSMLRDVGVEVQSLGRRPGTGGRGGLVAVLRLAARLRRHRCDVLHTHGPLCHLIGGLAKRFCKGVSHVVTVHSSNEPWDRRTRRSVGSAAVVYCSAAARRAGGHDARRSWTIPNGIALPLAGARHLEPRQTVRRSLGVGKEDVLILSVGSLRPCRNYEVALQAVATFAHRVPNRVVYCICGGGEASTLRARATDLGLGESAQFLGVRSDVPDLLGAADCFLSASVYEGLPLSVLEALASGIPLVLSRIDEHVDIAEGVSGVWFGGETGGPSLAEALECAHGGPPKDRRTVLDERSDVLERFSLEACVSGYERVYETVVQERSDPSPCVLVTSPSLDHNVSGISTLVRLWTERNSEVGYQVFVAAAPDGENGPLRRLVRQPGMVARFVGTLLRRRELRIVHVNMPLGPLSVPRDAVLCLLAKAMRRKLVLHLHGGRFAGRTKAPWPIYRLIGIALRLADRVIVLARTERDDILAEHGTAEQKIAVVPNCADEGPPPARKALHEERELNLGFMGRLDFEKGLREIVGALTELKNELRFTFHVAGAGPAESEFLELCQSRIPARFAFHGVVAGEARHRILSDADIFLLPSRFEGMPNSLLEFMGQGAVPIVTRVGAVGDVVVHEQNGLFVEVRDARALADAIRRLSKDPKLFEELSKNAIRTVQNRFSPARHIEGINAVYRALM